MTQLEATLGTLLLIAITVAMQCWVSARVYRSQYEDMWEQVKKYQALLDRYDEAWKKARTP